MHFLSSAVVRSSSTLLSHRTRVLLVAVGGLLVLAIPVRALLLTPVSPQDEGLLLLYPTQVLRGAVPNHSFESVYGPSSIWAIAIAFKIFGTSVYVERLLGVAYWLITSLAVGALVRRHRGLWVGGIAAAMSLYLLVGSATETRQPPMASAWMGSVAFGVLGLNLVDRQGANRSFSLVAGACFGLAVSFRLDALLPVVLTAVVVALGHRCRELAFLAVGFLVGLLPMIANLIQAGPVAVFRGEVVQPIFQTGPDRRLPLGWLTASQLVLLAACVGAAALLLALGMRAMFKGLAPHALLLAGAFGLGVLPEAFQRSDLSHVVNAACIVIPFALLAPSPPMLRARPWRLLPGLCAFGCASPAIWAPYSSEFAAGIGLHAVTAYDVSNDARSIPVEPVLQPALRALVTILDSRSTTGESLFVGPSDLRRTVLNDTYIYFLFPRLKPGSFYLEMEPGVANSPTSRLATDVSHDRWLILTTNYDNPTEPNGSRHFGSSAANRVVYREFRLVAVAGPWILMERDDRPSFSR